MVESQCYLIIPLSLEDLKALIHEEIENSFKKFINVEEEDLLSIKEVGKRIGISAVTLHAWCKDGRLIKRKVPGSNRTRLSIKEVRTAFKEIRPYQKIKL